MMFQSNTTNAITSNKTGTLNTKSVTASQLATNSPILPHKMNGHEGNGSRGEPPALPPRGVSRGSLSRDASLTRKPPPPAVPPKRTSLTRSDLALFSADSVSHQFSGQFFPYSDSSTRLSLYEIPTIKPLTLAVIQGLIR